MFSHEFSHVVSCPKGKSNYALWSWHLALLPPASLLKALNASLKWFSGSWKQWILSLAIFCNNISPGHMTFSSQGCKKLESRESQCCAHQCGWSYPSKLEIKSQAKHMYSNCFNKMKLDLKFTIISGSVGLRPARRIAQSKLWSGVNIVGGYDNCWHLCYNNGDEHDIEQSIVGRISFRELF